MTIELTTDEHLLVSEALKSYLRDLRNKMILPNFPEVKKQMREDYSALSTIITKIDKMLSIGKRR